MMIEDLRSTKQGAGHNVQYYYDASSRLVNEMVDGNKVTLVNGHLPLMRRINNAYYYYVYNGHGDVIGLLDQNGNMVNEYRYDIWGEITSSKEAVYNELKYASEIYDEETNNYYLRARYYNPETHRFISVDSYEGELKTPLTMNQNIYCLNNPLIYVDPSGNNALDIIAGWAYATDEDWFFCAAQTLSGNETSDYMSNEDFNDGYTAGKVTNKIYAAYSLGSSLGNLASSGGTLVTETGELVTAAGTMIKEEGIHLFIQLHAATTGFTSGGSKRTSDSAKGALKDAMLPTQGKIRYVPPEKWTPSQPLPKKNGGYIDKFGNVWTKGPSRTEGQHFEWDVQLSKTGKQKLGQFSRDGKHLNVSLDGKITHK